MSGSHTHHSGQPHDHSHDHNHDDNNEENHQHNDSHNHQHDHQHNHDHSHIPNNKKVLIISFILIAGFMLVEFVGGIITNSLALLSDAGHMLSDAVALGVALLAVYISQKAISERKSFGYQRFEILAAALNGITLIAISLYICIEAILRFQQPEHIQIIGMLVISSLGLLINIIVAWFMFKNSDTEHDLNMRSAYLHVLSDMIGSIGAIIAALCLYFLGWEWADPLASIFVALLVLRSGIQVTRKATHILMQGTPERFDLQHIKTTILAHPLILDLHDLHVWSLSSKQYILSCHIVVDAQISMRQVQDLLNELEDKIILLGIQHTTIQTETIAHQHAENLHALEQQPHKH